MRWVLLLVLLFGCDTNEKQQSISLDYSHPTRYSSREVAVRHNIKVEPNIADTDLDSNMTARITVPIDVQMTVDYKNYTTTYPNIYYEYGSSDPFTVTAHSPNSITISISTAINSNYPIEETETIDNETTECTENCTVDNETITYTDNTTWSDNFTQGVVTTQTQRANWRDFWDNLSVSDNWSYISVGHIDNVTWSDNFTRGVTTTQTQRVNWRDFWDNLSVSDNWSYISVGHIDNVTHFCDNSSVVSRIITQIQTDNITNWNTSCNEQNWITGGCGAGLSIELSVKQSGTGDCACNRTNDNTTTIRPAITNRNWGGVGVTCGASSQSLEVILKR